MINPPPGGLGEMPTAPDAFPTPEHEAPATPSVAAPESGEATESPAPPAPEMGQAPPPAPAPVAPPPAPAPPPPPANPLADPALRPWLEQAVTLQQQTQTVTSRIASLETEQTAADNVYRNLLMTTFDAEQRQVIQDRYMAERAQREQAWREAKSQQERLGYDDQRLGAEFQMWQRQQQMERLAEPMAVDLLVRDAQQRDPNLPANELRQYLQGFPANVMQLARDRWVDSYQRQRLAGRAASGVDAMGPSATSGGTNWDAYSGHDLIRAGVRQMAGR